MTILLVGLTLALWSLTAARAFLAIARTPKLRPPSDPVEPPPRLVAFVPVRDEIEVLPTFLPALLAQRGVELEVVVYDDGSSDGSGVWLDELAGRESRLTVLHGQGDPPPGWCGKPHALTRAVEHYRGSAELWLFVDADLELEPDAVAALVHDLEQNRADVASPMPTLLLRTFWARVLGPNFASLATLPYPPAKVNDPDDPTAFFNGQIVLMRRTAYEASGGFAAVRDAVLEDVALARRLQQGGAKLRVLDGQALVGTEMYRSFGEHVQGWGKNIFPLVGGQRGRAIFLAGFLLVMTGLPLGCLVSAGLLWLQGTLPLAALAMLGYLIPVGLQTALRARARAAPSHALFAPLGALVVATTLLRAALLQPSVQWKGRRYDPAAGD